jgi:hypothetical protein
MFPRGGVSRFASNAKRFSRQFPPIPRNLFTDGQDYDHAYRSARERRARLRIWRKKKKKERGKNGGKPRDSESKRPREPTVKTISKVRVVRGTFFETCSGTLSRPAFIFPPHEDAWTFYFFFLFQFFSLFVFFSLFFFCPVLFSFRVLPLPCLCLCFVRRHIALRSRMNPPAASCNQSITIAAQRKERAREREREREREKEREKEERSCKGVQFIDDRFVKSNVRIERVAAPCRAALQLLLHKSADIADVDATNG